MYNDTLCEQTDMIDRSNYECGNVDSEVGHEVGLEKVILLKEARENVKNTT